MNEDSKGLAARAALDFGRMLRKRRLALGVTQGELAESLGCGRRFLIDLEAGKPTSQIGLALAVAIHLGVVAENDLKSTDLLKITVH